MATKDLRHFFPVVKSSSCLYQIPSSCKDVKVSQDPKVSCHISVHSSSNLKRKQRDGDVRSYYFVTRKKVCLNVKPRLENIPLELVEKIVGDFLPIQDWLRCSAVSKALSKTVDALWSCHDRFSWFKTDSLSPQGLRYATMNVQVQPIRDLLTGLVHRDYHSQYAFFLKHVNVEVTCESSSQRPRCSSMSSSSSASDSSYSSSSSSSSSAPPSSCCAGHHKDKDPSQPPALCPVTICKIRPSRRGQQELKLSDFTWTSMCSSVGRSLQGVVLQGAVLVSASALMSLGGCSKLKILFLDNCTNINDQALTSIAKGCRELSRVSLSGASQLTDASISALAANCSKLWELNLSGCTSLTDKALCALGAGCRLLEKLLLGAWRIDDNQAWKGLIALETVQVLSLLQCSNIGDRTLGVLKLMKSLKRLDLRCCPSLTPQATETFIAQTSTLQHVLMPPCIDPEAEERLKDCLAKRQ